MLCRVCECVFSSQGISFGWTLKPGALKTMLLLPWHFWIVTRKQRLKLHFILTSVNEDCTTSLEIESSAADK